MPNKHFVYKLDAKCRQDIRAFVEQESFDRSSQGSVCHYNEVIDEALRLGIEEMKIRNKEMSEHS